MAGGNRKQGNISRSLDRFSYFALMLRTIARYPPGNDFAPFGYKSTESSRVFVIYRDLLVRTETANLSALESSLFPETITPCGCSFVTHLCNPPLLIILQSQIPRLLQQVHPGQVSPRQREQPQLPFPVLHSGT